MVLKSLKKIQDRVQQKPTFWAQEAKLDFALDMVQLMERRGMTKADLADALNVAPPYITKALRGDANLTIDSMVKFARALKGKVCIKLTEEDAEQRWFVLYNRPAVANARGDTPWAQLDVAGIRGEPLTDLVKNSHETKLAAA